MFTVETNPQAAKLSLEKSPRHTGNSALHLATNKTNHQNENYASQKRLTRILRDLGQDIKRQNKSLKLPSTWLIRQLVNQHCPAEYALDWRKSLITILMATDHSLKVADTLTQENHHATIFPKQGGFTRDDARHFARCALEFLSQQSPQDPRKLRA